MVMKVKREKKERKIDHLVLTTSIGKKLPPTTPKIFKD